MNITGYSSVASFKNMLSNIEKRKVVVDKVAVEASPSSKSQMNLSESRVDQENIQSNNVGFTIGKEPSSVNREKASKKPLKASTAIPKANSNYGRSNHLANRSVISTTSSSSRTGLQSSSRMNSSIVQSRIPRANPNTSLCVGNNRSQFPSVSSVVKKEFKKPSTTGALSQRRNQATPQKKNIAADSVTKAELTNMKQMNESLHQELEQLKADSTVLKDQLSSKSSQCNEYEIELMDLRPKREQLAILQKQYTESQTLVSHLQSESRSKSVQISALEERIAGLEQENFQSKVQNKTMQNKILKMNEQISQGEKKIDMLEKEVQKLEKDLELSKKTIDDLESKRRSDENLRRVLHNKIQELKGNIRVYCRLRPLSSEEQKIQSSVDFIRLTSVDDQPNKGIEIAQEGKGMYSSQNLLKFQFDHVFHPSSSQGDVFGEISQLTQSAVDGYKVCIFAYGQTGSGKTFTMEGDRHNHNLRGMIPRSVEQIFETTKSMKDQGWSYKIEVSFLEIYNEVLRDLLDPSTELNNVPTDIRQKSLEIKHDHQGNTTVTNLTYVTVNKLEQVYELLKIAGKNRAVSSNECNSRSSRSHSVFTLKIVGNNESTQQTTNGVLNLIDLAGSERLKKSQSTGDNLKEAQHINASLATLGDVICHLAKKSKHIPFRNSKLTYLLQGCLGGDCKTLMFVNISPLQSNVHETICSLRFATKVNACEIGTARRKIDTKTSSDLNSSILSNASILSRK